jgi:osmotically-inducible protein OsmY
MKMMSFLAGMATGVLLAQSMVGRRDARPAGQAPRRSAGADNFRSSGPERDYPTHSPPRGDDELRERICSRLQRTIENPEAIRVDVQGGCVTLRGQVQARDTILLMAELENTTGVSSVRNELEIQGSLEEVTTPVSRRKPPGRKGGRTDARQS